MVKKKYTHDYKQLASHESKLISLFYSFSMSGLSIFVFLILLTRTTKSKYLGLYDDARKIKAGLSSYIQKNQGGGRLAAGQLGFGKIQYILRDSLQS